MPAIRTITDRKQANERVNGHLAISKVQLKELADLQSAVAGTLGRR
jgi:hypothetical protein